VNLSSGGLAIVAIAAIWFLVFLPAFIRGDQAKSRAMEEIRVAEESVKKRLGTQAGLALRARRSRTILATLSIAAFIVSTFSVLEIVATGSSLPLGICASIATAVFVSFTFRANRSYKNLLSGSVRRTIPLNISINSSSPKRAEQIVDTWKPEALPKQVYLQTGAIEIVEMAEVVSIENEESKDEIANLDEILRRRRHVG
jgi:predicted secreted protein